MLDEVFFNNYLFNNYNVSIKEIPFKLKKHTRRKQIISYRKRYNKKILNCYYLFDKLLESQNIITVYAK